VKIPAEAWRRPIGLPYEASVRPRVAVPMIDDGPWGGVPLGGLGSGSIGRTHRGDFARWHLDVGRHRFETVAANQFSLYTKRGGDRQAHVLSTIRPDALSGWAWDLPIGAGTYHALFPNAWFEIDWDRLPVSLVQRQFSPVIPHNYRESSWPVGVFETEIVNRTDEAVTVGLMFSWQNLVGWTAGEDRRGGHRNEAVRRDGLAGIVMTGPSSAADEAWDGSFAIAGLEDEGVALSVFDRFSVDDGSAVWADFAADGRFDEGSHGGSSADGEAIAGAVAATVDLPPAGSRTLRFALAWDLPIAEFGVGTRWHRRYTRDVGTSGRNAWWIAETALRCADEWTAAIERWQGPILADPQRPDWYKGALFNELYFAVDGGTAWTDGPPWRRGRAEPVGALPGPPVDASAAASEPSVRPAPDDGSPPDFGRFGFLECLDYPFYNTLDVNFYASFALLLLWPELERVVIRDFVDSVGVHDPAVVQIEASGLSATRKCPGALPHDVGAPGDDPFLRLNAYKFQNVNIWKDLNCKFVLQLWRDRVVLDDPELATSAWPAVIEALDHIAAFDRDGDGLPEHDGEPDQTYDTWPMHGPSAYGGGLWLAALRVAFEIGEVVGDTERVAGYRQTLSRATAAYETGLWNGRHYRYDGGGPSADSIMADQLAGQWYADAIGLGDVVAPGRVLTTLRTIFEANVAGFAAGEMGAVNGTRPDGSVDTSSEQSAEVWVGTTYALAAFMLGRGMRDEAWRTAWGAWNVTYNRGLWFRTPEAYDEAGNFRASLYLRPLAIWAIEHALATRPEAASEVSQTA
jgi:non-lysosomal glucosylceramidase